MQKTLVNKWIAMLRSGKFIQTTRRLRTTDNVNGTRHCCLGVACELYVKEMHAGHWEDRGRESDDVVGTMEFFTDNCDESNDVELPDTVADWIQISDDLVRDLIRMNDEDGASFDEIANYLETSLTLELNSIIFNS